MLIIIILLVSKLVTIHQTEVEVVVVSWSRAEETFNASVRCVSPALAGCDGAVDGVFLQQLARIGCHDAVHPSLAQLRCHILHQRHTAVIAAIVPFPIAERGSEGQVEVLECLAQTS